MQVFTHIYSEATKEWARQRNPGRRQIHTKSTRTGNIPKLDLEEGRRWQKRKGLSTSAQMKWLIKSQWSKVDVCFCHNRFLQFSIKSEEVKEGFSIYSRTYPKSPPPSSFEQAVTGIYKLIRTDKAILSFSQSDYTCRLWNRTIQTCARGLIWLRYFRFT